MYYEEAVILIVSIGIFIWFVFSIKNLHDEIRNVIINQRKIMKHLGVDYEPIKYGKTKEPD